MSIRNFIQIHRIYVIIRIQNNLMYIQLSMDKEVGMCMGVRRQQLLKASVA